MPRPPAPCGTFTAYKRHRRNDEPVDDACAQAARDQRRNQSETKRDREAEVIQLALAPQPGEPEEIDELAEARWALRAIKGAMEAGGTAGFAALAKQYVELVAQIKRLETAAKPKEESALDRIARRRSERITASSS